MIEEKPEIESAHKKRIQDLKIKHANEQKARTKKLRETLGAAFGTPEGQQALKLIAELCGYNKTVIGGNPTIGMDVVQGTLYNCGRQSVYLELRAMVPSDILKQIEFQQTEEML